MGFHMMENRIVIYRIVNRRPIPWYGTHPIIGKDIIYCIFAPNNRLNIFVLLTH